jgi:hypothetical protein
MESETLPLAPVPACDLSAGRDGGVGGTLA